MRSRGGDYSLGEERRKVNEDGDRRNNEKKIAKSAINEYSGSNGTGYAYVVLCVLLKIEDEKHGFGIMKKRQHYTRERQ